MREKTETKMSYKRKQEKGCFSKSSFPKAFREKKRTFPLFYMISFFFLLAFSR